MQVLDCLPSGGFQTNHVVWSNTIDQAIYSWMSIWVPSSWNDDVSLVCLFCRNSIPFSCALHVLQRQSFSKLRASLGTHLRRPFRFLRRRWGWPNAVTVTPLLTQLWHIDWSQMLRVFVRCREVQRLWTTQRAAWRLKLKDGMSIQAADLRSPWFWVRNAWQGHLHLLASDASSAFA